MPAEFASERSASADCGKNGRRTSCFNPAPAASAGEIHYCGRCNTLRTVTVAISRVLVATGGSFDEVLTRTCSCPSCGSLLLSSTAGTGYLPALSTHIVHCRRPRLKTAAVRRGRP